MELRQILSLFGKWLWLIVLSVVIAAGSSFFASRMATPLYRTKTTLMVGETTTNPDPNSADIYTGQQLAYTYSQLARREPVLQGVIETLGLQASWEALSGQVSASIVPQTQLLEISFIDSDPYRAKVITDEIARQLILQSPAGASLSPNSEMDFIREQVEDLKTKIETGKGDLERLQQELDASNSASQIQDLQNQVDLLENKISNWQNTYSQLMLSLKGGDVNVLTVMEEATVPTTPISPNVKMNVLVAAAIGLALAVGGIFLMEYLDDTIKLPDEIEKATGLPTIGKIVQITGKTDADKLVAAREPLNPIVESFRALRNNIQYMEDDQPHRILLITSVSPNEGKSIVLANLAVVMAQAGQRVILVDGDFRHPTQERIFNINNETGLSTAINLQTYPVKHYLQDVDIENLRILPSGPLPPNPVLLLESKRLKERLNELKDMADVVLFDSPPFMTLSDAAILGTQVDGVMLVVDAGRTRTKDFCNIVKEMNRIHIPLIGVVLNRANRGSTDSYYHYYHNYYKSDTKPRSDQARSKVLGWLKRGNHQGLEVNPVIKETETETLTSDPSVDLVPVVKKTNSPIKPRKRGNNGEHGLPPAAEVQKAELLAAVDISEPVVEDTAPGVVQEPVVQKPEGLHKPRKRANIRKPESSPANEVQEVEPLAAVDVSEPIVVETKKPKRRTKVQEVESN